MPRRSSPASRCSALLAPALALLGGCGGSADVPGFGPADGWETRYLMEVHVRPELDLLFVIDDSSSMAQEQQSLARNMPELVRVLESFEGGLPSLHIGVISTNVGTGAEDGTEGGGGPGCAGQGDNGVLQVPDGCPPLTDGARFIRHERRQVDGDPITVNYEGPLEEQLACMARLGTDGCEFEQPLEAMRRALSDWLPSRVQNAGFLRDDAHLAVIFIGDEDDCSARDRGLFDPTQDHVEAPLGELSSFRCFEFGMRCEGTGDERAPGPREGCVPDEDSPYLEPVASYVEFFPRRATWQNFCDYSAAAMELDLLRVLLGVSLLYRSILLPECLADAPDPFDCQVWEVERYGGMDQNLHRIPSCAAEPEARPCYELTPAPECSPFRIRRSREPRPGTVLVIQCPAD